MLNTPSSRFADPHHAVLALGELLGPADRVLGGTGDSSCAGDVETEEARPRSGP